MRLFTDYSLGSFRFAIDLGILDARPCMRGSQIARLSIPLAGGSLVLGSPPAAGSLRCRLRSPFRDRSTKPFSSRHEALVKHRGLNVEGYQTNGVAHVSRPPQPDLPPVSQNDYCRHQDRWPAAHDAMTPRRPMSASGVPGEVFGLGTYAAVGSLRNVPAAPAF